MSAYSLYGWIERREQSYAAMVAAVPVGGDASHTELRERIEPTEGDAMNTLLFISGACAHSLRDRGHEVEFFRMKRPPPARVPTA